MLALLSLAALLIAESIKFFSSEVEETLTLDDSEFRDSLALYFDVSVYGLPCAFAQVDIHDYLSRAHFNVSEQLTKQRIAGESGELELEVFEKIDGFGSFHRDHARGGGDDVVPKLSSIQLGSAQAESLTPNNFHATLRSRNDSFSFIDFFASWCVYCQRMAPEWKKLAETVKEKQIDVRIFKVDCVHYQGFCEKEGVAAYPTLRMYHGDRPLDHDFTGMRNVDHFLHFIEETTGEHAREDGSRKALASEVNTKLHVKEGCRISSSLELPATPGSIRIHASSNEHSFPAKELNISHAFRQIYFRPRPLGGDQTRHHDTNWKRVPERVKNFAFNEYIDLAFVSSEPHRSMDHYMKLVPTTYQNLRFYQMTMTNMIFRPQDETQVPEIRLTYDLSSVGVHLKDKSLSSWYQFLTNLCAILGGVYVVWSLADRLVFTVAGTKKKE